MNRAGRAGRDALDGWLGPLRAAPERSALIVDFDGTLAPIVDHPPDATPLPAAVTALRRLRAGRLGRLAVVSGRPVAFLAGVVPVDGLELFGQYGLERRTAGGEVVVAPEAQRFAGAVARAADAADAAAARNGLAGLFVERKGTLAVALHWRARPELGPAATELGRRLAGRSGLRLEEGRMTVELRPPVDRDKGDAAAEVADGAAAAVMIGDDRGDVAAFSALGRLAAGGRLGHAVRIAVRSSENPPELLAAADVAVDGPADVVAILGRLADGLA